jgi:transposase-like protein
MLCPQCGEHTHRSHTRGFREKLVKALTSHKTYRCHECGWRGWLRTADSSKRRHTLRTIISVLVTLLITTLLALYVIEKLSLPSPSAGSEQQQTP